MNKRKFNKQQMEQLSKNQNVKKCGEKTITYSQIFKTKAVQQYDQEGLSPPEIFTEAGFDIEIIGKKTPCRCLGRWNKIYRTKGLKNLSEEKRGRPREVKNSKDKSGKDKIERLEAEVAYLKEENDFLAKLRAKERQN